MKTKEWVLFILLGLIWGSSFLWIKIAVQDVSPMTLVAFRLLFGVIALAMVMAALQPRFPVQRSTWLVMVVLGITNTFLPFVLISWGEQYIDSAVASVLNSTVPLFTLVIAHFFLRDERMTSSRVIGLLIGFGGVVALTSRDLGPEGFRGSVLGQGAVLAGALSYGVSSVFARRTLRSVDPLAQAFVPLASACGLSWLAAPIVEAPFRPPQYAITWFALMWLGLLGACVAYLIYFHLIHTVGPTRATMVTYMFPVVGVVLGVVFLGERGDWHLILGAALVAVGMWMVNQSPRLVMASAPGD